MILAIINSIYYTFVSNIHIILFWSTIDWIVREHSLQLFEYLITFFFFLYTTIGLIITRIDVVLAPFLFLQIWLLKSINYFIITILVLINHKYRNVLIQNVLVAINFSYFIFWEKLFTSISVDYILLYREIFFKIISENIFWKS